MLAVSYMTPRFRLALLVALLGVAAFAPGCGGPPAKVPHAVHARAPRGDVADDQLGLAVRELLAAEPGSAERRAGLQGVLGRQLARAAGRFAAGRPERGLVSVHGALSLVHAGELGALGAGARAALSPAAIVWASGGDDGRARAAYELLARVGSGAEQADAKEHLGAIAAWSRAARSRKSMLAAAAAVRAAIGRRVLEPSDEALADAVLATLEWIRAAVEIRTSFRSHAGTLTQEEAYEARRALEAGGVTLVLLHLRDADAVGALKALDRGQARPLVRDDTVKALEAVADRPTAERWTELLRALSPGEAGSEDEIPVDRDLLRTAAFSVACEAYRLDPTQVEPVIVVADGFQAFGMADVAPVILADLVRAHPEARIVSAATSVTLRAMAGEADAQEPDAARRAFRAAQPLLAAADVVKGVVPSAARVRSAMGEIELREGRLPAARELLLQSARAETSGAVLLSLARVERHQGDSAAALLHLQQGRAAPDAAQDPALDGEILLMQGDMARERGDAAAARAPLTEALQKLSHAPASAAPEDRAHALRVLAQVLTRFGAVKNAERALDRAFDATPRDKQQIAATLGLAIAGALVRGDVEAARDGLARSVGAELDTGDLVYHALWVRLLERTLRARTNGAADRAFATILGESGWTGKLAMFGAGKLRPGDLAGAAKTDVQKVEAVFYVALDRRASGDAKGADDALRQVLALPGVELMETAIARDLLAGPRAIVGPPPPNVPLP